MTYKQGLKRAGQCIAVVGVVTLSGCIWYTPKMLPRLNQTDIGNYPMNCTDNGINYRHWRIDLTKNPLSKYQQVLWLTNTSREPLVIDMLVKKPSKRSRWASLLDAQNWSALYDKARQFTLVCKSAGDRHRDIDCATRVRVCWMPVTGSKRAFRANYWVAEDMTMQGVYEVMYQRGFRLLPTGE